MNSIDYRGTKPGIYVSKKEVTPRGDTITTIDLRMKQPNTLYVCPEAMHTIEHLASTFLSKDSELKDKVLHFGPMASCTGFCIILQGDWDSYQLVHPMQRLMTYIRDYKGAIPGAAFGACGNYLYHNLTAAKKEAASYLECLNEIKVENLIYPKENNSKTSPVMITVQQLKKVMPNALSKNVDTYLPYLNEYMPKFGIEGKLRICHFLAQVAHESGEFRYSQEIASGKAYDTGKLAVALGNTPEADGDGQKYKGRGLIQLTGTTNYRRFNEYLQKNFGNKADVLKNPEIVATPEYAVMTACWFFATSGCLALADKDDIKAVTKRVNGGLNGFDQRKKYYERAKSVFA